MVPNQLRLSGAPAGHTGHMELDAAHLSSLSTALGELTQRVTDLAEGFQGSPREDAAAALYEVERNLQAAHRRLRSLVQTM